MNIAFDRMKKRLIERGAVAPDAKLMLVGSQHTREVAADEATIPIVAMTDQIATDQLIVVPKGCDDTYIKNNRKRVFLDHDTDFYSCVGTLRDYKILDTQITANVALAKSHEDYAQLIGLIRDVGVGTSIGAEIVEMTPPMKGDPAHYFGAKRIIREWRWMELSLTMMPADVWSQAEGERVAGPELVRSLTRLHAEGRVGARLVRRLGVDLAPAPVRRKIVYVRKP